ncbi:hypothetical protein QE152_g35665 [Popillia japonica]|uniref:Uncharacterized protein n=1 Tax=Popillia japonica TaxID=7064 RepID=A0AAW1IFK6_POPJA
METKSYLNPGILSSHFVGMKNNLTIFITPNPADEDGSQICVEFGDGSGSIWISVPVLALTSSLADEERSQILVEFTPNPADEDGSQICVEFGDGSGSIWISVPVLALTSSLADEERSQILVEFRDDCFFLHL